MLNKSQVEKAALAKQIEELVKNVDSEGGSQCPQLWSFVSRLKCETFILYSLCRQIENSGGKVQQTEGSVW